MPIDPVKPQFISDPVKHQRNISDLSNLISDLISDSKVFFFFSPKLKTHQLAQSTISICSLFIFITLLRFTLSTFEPTPINRTHPTSQRRFLSQKPLLNYIYNPKPKPKTNIKHNFELRSSWFWKTFMENSNNASKTTLSPTALQGMGTLYRRGTKAMNNLVVAHLLEDATEDDSGLFLRALHRSGLTARADIVFVFATSSFSSKFGVTRFTNARKKEKKKDMGGEPIWGKRIRSNFSNSDDEEGEDVSAELSYGSVVGFESSELDPENSLSGLLDKVSMSLRRWTCYPMLLGRLRRNFKHASECEEFYCTVVLRRVRNRGWRGRRYSVDGDEPGASWGRRWAMGSRGRDNVQRTL